MSGAVVCVSVVLCVRDGWHRRRKSSPADLLSKAPLFGAADRLLLAHTLAEHLLPTHLSPNEHQVFRDAPYEQTRHLFDVIQDHGQDIARNMEMVLAEAGVGLTEDAGRAAYFAGLHATQAFIFETTGPCLKDIQASRGNFRGW